jgi:hypothetical protein
MDLSHMENLSLFLSTETESKTREKSDFLPVKSTVGSSADGGQRSDLGIWSGPGCRLKTVHTDQVVARVGSVRNITA